jgi:ankyrin repeat protein
MSAASNAGNWAAEIMQVLLKYPFNFYKNSLGMNFDSARSMSLLFAVQNESQSGPKIVELLLNKGVDPNTPYFNEGITPVYFAASNQGNHATEILKLLLEKGGACDVLLDQFEPVHLAIMNCGSSALELFNLLVGKRGFNVIHETSGSSLIHFVALNAGDCGPNILKKLLENGAKVNHLSNEKLTPLHMAAKDDIFESNQQISIMKILLENDGNPNAVDEYGRTPVHFAAGSLSGEHAHEKLKLLLDHGGKLTSKDANGFNPFHYTLLNMGVRGAEMREIVGVNRETTNVPLNRNGITLLHWIVCQGKILLPSLSDPSKHYRKVDLVQLILDNGGNPNAVDKDGYSPVHRAVFLKESYDGLNILQLLLEKGENPNLLDEKEQCAPIHYVAEDVSETALEQMKILLKNRGDANVSGKDGATPLHLTAINLGNGPKLTGMLLECGGNPNLTENVMKRTTLHLVIQNKNENDQKRLDIVKLLLENGANPNAGDKQGSTPVHYVVKDNRSNSLNVLKLLLEHGGNILQKNNEGITPHLMVTQKGSKKYCRPEVKKFIIKTYRKMK